MSDNLESFEEVMFGAVPYEDVRNNYMPRHLSRRDMRAHKRARLFNSFDAQLAIGGIVAAGIVTGLVILAIVAELVSR